METKANYVVIGAFTFTIAVAAVLFGLWAAKFTVDTAWNRYEVLFTESVIGLSDGSPVLYNGVNVGRVTDLLLNPEDVREVIATIQVEATVPIHEDTVATIRLTGLTGTAAIQLRGGTPGSPLLKAQRDELPRIPSVSSPLNTLLESSEGIVVTANRVMNQIDKTFSEENVKRISGALASAERLGNSLTDPEGDFARLLTNISEASTGLPELIARLDQTTRRLDEVLTGVDRDLVEHLPELRARLDSTLANLDSLSGRLDAIVARNQDELSRIGGIGMRQVSGGLEELRRLIRDMSAVLRQIERNPSQFLFGGEQPEEYTPR
ncbi:MAG: MlaD family protein [Wenzhouxiangellaceae bacterium]|nr:MlaD family protein [Wenzhouxiangellaceae bacterium]